MRKFWKWVAFWNTKKNGTLFQPKLNRRAVSFYSKFLDEEYEERIRPAAEIANQSVGNKSESRKSGHEMDAH